MIETICVWANVAICFAIMVICVRRQGSISGINPREATRGRLSNALLGSGALIMALSPVWRHRPEWPCVLFAFVVLVCLLLDSPRWLRGPTRTEER